ncbi:MAG: bifunctional DNA-binding transcriptional regulator/O6-methylguanine-DNA methyltransferase Ada [Acidobacteria bacterium]|nr:bifunctional DNA-binding transcriptional regulator/O6-methylguanine-DNA methyltransferase Ada [Acidobacteriota bacterium]
MPNEDSQPETLDETACWEAVIANDSTKDGQFYFGVMTTGVYCRPSCKARLPLRKNVRFYKSPEAAERDGLRPCKRCHPKNDNDAHAGLMHDICRYIDTHSDEKLDLKTLAAQAMMSESHFQKTFKTQIGVSPRAYQEALRLERVRGALQKGESISGAIYSAGYGSGSRVYEKIDGRLGMTPKAYREGGRGESISYATARTQLGPVMIAATDRGVCFLQFDDFEEDLAAQLKKEFPRATIAEMPNALRDQFDLWIAALNDYLSNDVVDLKLPLDIRGTAFQLKVWSYLQTIPSGELQSYKEVAEATGNPKSVRAVATACASNRIAIAIPCHRVIRGNGELAGYRWGLPRKRALIDLERNSRSARKPKPCDME